MRLTPQQQSAISTAVAETFSLVNIRPPFLLLPNKQVLGYE